MVEPLYLTQYIERLATGTGGMIRRCRDAGLSEPLFAVDDGFRLTLERPAPQASTPVTKEETTEETQEQTTQETGAEPVPARSIASRGDFAANPRPGECARRVVRSRATGTSGADPRPARSLLTAMTGGGLEESRRRRA
jgi:hypothetical protein